MTLPPLPVETAARLRARTLSDAERQRAVAAVEGFVADMVTVCAYAIGNTDIPVTRTLAALIDSLGQRRVPDLRVLSRATDYVLFDLDWRRESRRLTADEYNVLGAATRLTRAFYGPDSRWTR